MHRLLFLLMVAAVLPGPAQLRAADAVESLRQWTSLEDLNLPDLTTGKIFSTVNASMKLDRGMASQAVFLVGAPVETTVRTLANFNATRHPELSVFQHHVFADEKSSGFEKLVIDPKSSASAALISSLGDASVVQLSQKEAPLVPKQRTADATQQFLSGVLRARWKKFAATGDFGSVGTYDSGSEMRSLLGEEKKVAAHFGPLLAPITAKAAPGTPKYHYWDLSTVDKKSAVQLGVVYAGGAPGQRQVLDITYFSSGGYLVAISLYEMLPVTIDGAEKTVVWQGSMVTATGLAGGLGVKRKIGSRMMLGDVEKWIRIFRNEAESAAR